MAKKILKIAVESNILIAINKKMVNIKIKFFLFKESTLSRNFSKTASLANNAPKRKAGVKLKHRKDI